MYMPADLLKQMSFFSDHHKSPAKDLAANVRMLEKVCFQCKPEHNIAFYHAALVTGLSLWLTMVLLH